MAAAVQSEDEQVASGNMPFPIFSLEIHATDPIRHEPDTPRLGEIHGPDAKLPSLSQPRTFQPTDGDAEFPIEHRPPRFRRLLRSSHCQKTRRDRSMVASKR